MLAKGTFDGRVAIVTGGGSEIGRAIALELARLGGAGANLTIDGGNRLEQEAYFPALEPAARARPA